MQKGQTAANRVNFVQPVNAATFTGDKAAAVVAIPSSNQ